MLVVGIGGVAVLVVVVGHDKDWKPQGVTALVYLARPRKESSRTLLAENTTCRTVGDNRLALSGYLLSTLYLFLINPVFAPKAQTSQLAGFGC